MTSDLAKSELSFWEIIIFIFRSRDVGKNSAPDFSHLQVIPSPFQPTFVARWLPILRNSSKFTIDNNVGRKSYDAEHGSPPCKVLAAFCGWRVRLWKLFKRHLDIDIVLFSLGGMCGAIVTSPFDVVKTRLQSSLFREGHAAVGVIGNGSGSAILHAPRHSGLLWNFVETGHILRSVCFNPLHSPPPLFLILIPTAISTETNPHAHFSKDSDQRLSVSFQHVL